MVIKQAHEKYCGMRCEAIILALGWEWGKHGIRRVDEERLTSNAPCKVAVK